MTPALVSDPPEGSVAADIVAGIRVLILAGIPTGLLFGGVGGRLAMLLLRFTSPKTVRGVTSDDGFEIGRFTVGGTYNLLLLGATFGVIGAALYQWVAPWLLGPRWFRRLTVGLACGSVVGSLLVHADGVDFVLLTPTWLAVALFVAIPALFGVCIGIAVDFLRNTTRPLVVRRPQTWVLPLALVLVFPVTLMALVPSVFVLSAWLQLRRSGLLVQVAAAPMVRVGVRAAWLLVAALGLRALLVDVADLGRTTG
jgi:hypothetical protein